MFLQRLRYRWLKPHHDRHETPRPLRSPRSREKEPLPIQGTTAETNPRTPLTKQVPLVVRLRRVRVLAVRGSGGSNGDHPGLFSGMGVCDKVRRRLGRCQARPSLKPPGTSTWMATSLRPCICANGTTLQEQVCRALTLSQMATAPTSRPGPVPVSHGHPAMDVSHDRRALVQAVSEDGCGVPQMVVCLHRLPQRCECSNGLLAATADPTAMHGLRCANLARFDAMHSLCEEGVLADHL